jgi:hypothetical protein
MKQGTEIVRRADPKAELKTQGYYTYPVYPEPPVQPLPAAGRQAAPVPIGWRVGQYLEVKTTNLAELPKTAAAAQKVLAINGINFGLAPATEKMLDDQRIAATYRNLNERIVSIARAMGRQPADAVIDTVDFEGSGNYAAAGRRCAWCGCRGARMGERTRKCRTEFRTGRNDAADAPGRKGEVQVSSAATPVDSNSIRSLTCRSRLYNGETAHRSATTT